MAQTDGAGPVPISFSNIEQAAINGQGGDDTLTYQSPVGGSNLQYTPGANPDAIALISYYPDGAQITRQIRNAGLTQPIVAGGSIYSPKFIELGGEAVSRG